MLRRIQVHFAVAILFLFSARAASAETVILKDGLVFKGKVVEVGKDSVRLETFKGPVVIPKALIKKQDKTKSLYELYQEELKKYEGKETDAGEQFKLGSWCRTKAIWHKAKFHLGKALEIDKDHAGAKKAFEETEKAWLDERKKSWIPIKLNIGVVVEMDKAEIEKLFPVIRECSKELARASGGLMFLQEVVFIPNSSAGEMQYDPNQPDKEVPGSANNFKHGKANWHPVCIIHELGHFFLRLADEYDTTIYGVRPITDVFCPKCKMSFPQNQPGEDWCSVLNHPAGAGNTPGCQETLIANFGKKAALLAEAFGWSQEEILWPPEPKITIQEKKPKK